MNKIFLEESQLIEDAFRLAVRIYESGFRPTFIVGLWRGGSAIGIYVQECLQTLGVETDHISLRTSYQGMKDYQAMLEDPGQIRVHGTQYLVDHLNADDRLLIVDDVFSSGHSIDAVLKRLSRQLKRNMPTATRTAVLYQRSNQARIDRAPDFCLHQTRDWLVFPYELKGLSTTEIAQHKPWLRDLIVPSLFDETSQV